MNDLLKYYILEQRVRNFPERTLRIPRTHGRWSGGPSLRGALAVVRPTSGGRLQRSIRCAAAASYSRHLESVSLAHYSSLQWGARVLRASTARAAPAADDEHVAAVGDVRAVGCRFGQGAPLSQQVSLLQDHRPVHVSASRPRSPGAAQHHHSVSTIFYSHAYMIFVCWCQFFVNLAQFDTLFGLTKKILTSLTTYGFFFFKSLKIFI